MYDAKRNDKKIEIKYTEEKTNIGNVTAKWGAFRIDSDVDCEQNDEERKYKQPQSSLVVSTAQSGT